LRTDDPQAQTVGDSFDLGHQRTQQVRCSGLQRTCPVAEQREVLAVGELVAVDPTEAFPIPDEIEEIVGAELCRGRQEVVAVLGQRGVTGIVDAVKEAQRLIASFADDSPLAQIVDDRRAMNLLHGYGSQLQHLRVATSRIGHVLHADLVSRAPRRVALPIAEKL